MGRLSEGSYSGTGAPGRPEDPQPSHRVRRNRVALLMWTDCIIGAYSLSLPVSMSLPYNFAVPPLKAEGLPTL